MRALVRWSDSSLTITTPRPCQGEPSRRMTLPRILEVAGVDGLEARLLDRQPLQAAAGVHHRRCRFWTHVAVGHQPPLLGAEHLHVGHAGNAAELLLEARSLRFDVDVEAAAQHLPAEIADRSKQHDVA